MTAVAGSSSEFALGALNAVSGGTNTQGWIRLDNIVSDIAFNITGTFVGTIALQVSNQTDETKTRYSTVTTYTTTQSPLNIPREVGRYFRFIMTAYTSGTAYVGFSKGIDANGQLVDLTPQGTASAGTGSF
jgi:hypothetical protein